jgi:hypothetical protein
MALTFFFGDEKRALADAFLNLGFESAVIGTTENHQLLASEVLPHWTCKTSTGDYILYDTRAIDAYCVSIHDTFSKEMQPLVGQYSVLLQDGTDFNTMELVTASIFQTGQVPAWAKSLTFDSDIPTYINELQVSINGTVIPFSLYSTDGTVNSKWGPVNTYICDVSAYASETVTLKFEKLVHDPLIPNHGIVDLDDIAFSTTPAPEPSSLAILGVGILSLFGYYWRRRNRAA